jgi:hypothetical protein
MPLEEKKVFIKDPDLDMTMEQKNKHLSAKLAVAPNLKRKIFLIERESSGWGIHYRIRSRHKDRVDE